MLPRALKGRFSGTGGGGRNGLGAITPLFCRKCAKQIKRQGNQKSLVDICRGCLTGK